MRLICEPRCAVRGRFAARGSLISLGIAICLTTLFAKPSGAATPIWTGLGPTSNWSDAKNWSPSSVPPNDGTADLQFKGSSKLTPAVDVAWSVHSIVFTSDAGAFSVGGPGPLTLGGGGLINNASNYQTIGTGVVLGTDQTWTCGTTGSGGFAVNGTIDTAGHTLTFNGPSAGAGTSGTISGGGSLVINIGMSLFGTNTYTGGTTLNGISVALTNDSGLGDASGPLVLNNAAINIQGTGGTTTRDITLGAGADAINNLTVSNLALNGNLHGPGSLSLKGTGANYTISLGGQNSYTGGTFVADTTLKANAGSLPGNVKLANQFAALQLSQSTNGVYAGNITGGGSVIINGTGRIGLTGTNTFTGPISVSQGTLELDPNGSAIPAASTLGIGSGDLTGSGPTGIVQFLGPATFTRGIGSGLVWSNGGGFAARNGPLTLNIGGALAPINVSITGSPQHMVFGSPTADNVTELQNPIYLGSNANTSSGLVVRVLQGAGGDSALLSGGISGAASFTKLGPGTLRLTAASTYTNTTTVGGGLLLVDGSLASAAVNVQTRSALGGHGSIAGRVTLTGGFAGTAAILNLVDGSLATLTLSDPNSTDAALTIGDTIGANLNFELGADSDHVVITNGKLVVNSGAFFSISTMPGVVPGVYDLIDFPAGQATGLSRVYLSTLHSPDSKYNYSLQTTATAIQLKVTPAPEPHCLGVVSLMAMALLGRRRALI
jgi:fibronectin-binding autotransporter adhesin